MRINLFKKAIMAFAVTTLLVPAVWLYAGNVLASGSANSPKKWTICHHTGSESNPYVRVTDSVKSVGGHFDNDGKPLHLGDFLLLGEQDCPNPTPTPKPGESPKPTPNPKPTPGPRVHPSPAPCTGCGSTVINITNNNNNNNENKNENKVGINNTSTSTASTNVNTPTRLPETGAGAVAMVSMFGAMPLGAALAKFRKGRLVHETEEENLGSVANQIANLRSALKQDA